MIVTRKFSKNLRDLELFLQGGISAGRELPASGENPGVYGLHGKTLIFTSPGAATVTFTNAGSSVQQPILVKDIKIQIETAVAALTVKFFDRRLVIIEDTPASGVAITGLGTANAVLGFDNIAVVGKVIKPGPAVKPYFLQLIPTTDGFVLMTEE